MSGTRFVVLAVLLATISVRAQKQVGITGVVLTPEGAPVTGGSVALFPSSNDRATAAIDKAGRFHVVPAVAERQALFVSVPGFAPYRVNLEVPLSKTMTLPDIRLLPATYFRARFVTPDGETVPPSVRSRSVDASGMTIPEPLTRAPDVVESDGAITLGPLPPGRTMLTFDRAPFAQMRLPEVQVTARGGIVDRGTIVVQPGAALLVEVVNTAGAPVPHHDVWLEDPVQPSSLFFSPQRTDPQGWVTFDRLAPGRYRVWTRAAERCGNQLLSLSRLVNVGSPATRVRLVVTGVRATFRVAWPLGALSGRLLSAAPEVPSSSPPWLPMGVSQRQGSCSQITDAEGRVTLAALPPGPTRITVAMFNSIFSRIVTVPEDGREIAIEIPDGLLSVHVTDRTTSRAVGSARLTWTAGGGTIEAISNPNGDALVEAVGTGGGTLGINARDYEEVEGSFEETPAAHQEVALKPLHRRVTVRVVASTGERVAGAILHMLPATPSEAGEIVVSDRFGMATVFDGGAGPLRLSVTADGFAAATVLIPEENRPSAVVTLSK